MSVSSMDIDEQQLDDADSEDFGDFDVSPIPRTPLCDNRHCHTSVFLKREQSTNVTFISPPSFTARPWAYPFTCERG